VLLALDLSMVVTQRCDGLRILLSTVLNFSSDHDSPYNITLITAKVPGLFVPWTIRTVTGRFLPCCKTDKN